MFAGKSNIENSTISDQIQKRKLKRQMGTIDGNYFRKIPEIYTSAIVANEYLLKKKAYLLQNSLYQKTKEVSD